MVKEKVKLIKGIVESEGVQFGMLERPVELWFSDKISDAELQTVLNWFPESLQKRIWSTLNLHKPMRV